MKVNLLLQCVDAFNLIGVTDFRQHTYIPTMSDRVRYAIDDYFNPVWWNPVTHQYESRRQGITGDSFSDRVSLVFSSLRASRIPPKGFSPFRSPMMVRIAAKVSNVSNHIFEANDMPRLYCSETNEAVHCTMQKHELMPGEETIITYSIMARDAYAGWMILQVENDIPSERYQFVGLNGLSKLIVESIEHCFDYWKPTLQSIAHSLLNDGLADRAHEVLNRMYAAMETGECFRADPRCVSSRYSFSITARDAYKTGYRPCMNCVGVDWWVSPVIDVSSGKVFWLSSESGVPIASWRALSDTC